jgi:hypothetical protein
MQRRFLALLLLAILVLSASPAFARDSANSTGAPNPSRAEVLPAGVVRALQSRGLIGGKLTEDLASGGIPAPPAGTEVEETRAGRIGADPSTTLKDWKEPLGKDWLQIRIAKRDDGGCDVSYWVLPADSLGCLIYVYKIYDKSGRVLRSEYWTHTNELKTASGKDFPPALYPYGPDGGIPASEIFRSLNTPAQGGSGALYTQYTPEGYVILDIWVDGVEEITVPAGKFSALHVMMRPNLESFLPDWPSFALKMFEPFLPKESFYFEAQPPYRFLKFEGIPGAAGPKVRSEMERYYIAGKEQVVASTAQ